MISISTVGTLKYWSRYPKYESSQLWTTIAPCLHPLSSCSSRSPCLYPLSSCSTRSPCLYPLSSCSTRSPCLYPLSSCSTRSDKLNQQLMTHNLLLQKDESELLNCFCKNLHIWTFPHSLLPTPYSLLPTIWLTTYKNCKNYVLHINNGILYLRNKYWVKVESLIFNCFSILISG